MQNNMSKCDLLNSISRVSFVMDELRLFLDTHPDNEEAVAYFNEMQKKRTALVAEYTRQYGNLTSYCPNAKAATWVWNCQPMPWEGV